MCIFGYKVALAGLNYKVMWLAMKIKFIQVYLIGYVPLKIILTMTSHMFYKKELITVQRDMQS